MKTAQTSDSLQKTLIIFAYAKAGLGHLRVTNALHKGLKNNSEAILLRSMDTATTYTHRFSSTHILARRILEWSQQGAPEAFFAKLYMFILDRQLNTTYQQISSVIDQRLELPKTVLIVATHFGLAHQISKIKTRLEEEHKVKIKLIVQITDDSPQILWYVPNADLTFAPSEFTRKTLIAYAKKYNLPKISIKVAPYPISPDLSKKITKTQLTNRIKQVKYSDKTPLNVMIPISGAAVGMMFYYKLIQQITKMSSKNIVFHVVTKKAPFTIDFINKIKMFENVKIYAAEHDRDVVELYEQIYLHTNIAIEITKPSEQAFKALTGTDTVGGAILLFASPVGRQEYDNLDFLRRHKLIPDIVTRGAILNRSEQKTNNYCFRGIELPIGSLKASKLFMQLLIHNTFQDMINLNAQCKEDSEEISNQGVKIFWNSVQELLRK